MNNLLKNIGIWLVIGLVVLTVVKQFDSRAATKDSVAYSEFMDSAKNGRVESATVEGRTIKWTSTDHKKYITYSPGDIWMVGDLVKYGVKVDAKPEEEQSFLAQIFISWFPMLLLIAVWIFFMRFPCRLMTVFLKPISRNIASRQALLGAQKLVGSLLRLVPS